MLKNLFSALFKSWKTTAGGVLALAGALLMAASSYVEGAGDNFEIGSLLVAIGAAASGFFGRDQKQIGE